MDQKIISPVIIETSDAQWESRLERLKKKHPEIKVVDHYLSQITELFKIRYPQDANNHTKLQKFTITYTKQKPLTSHGNWVYYPWRNSLVHLLPEKEFQEVRTARNRPIITPEQQSQFMNLTIGLVGLSVGNAIIQNVVYSGGANTIKIADPDTLDLSNLNRVQASAIHLGTNKAIITAQQIYEINPYANVIIYDEKIDASNLKDFLTGEPPLDVVIDECDDLTLKNYLRLTSRSLKLPFLSITDVGLESQVDFHRFDLSSKTAGMHEVPNFSLDDLIQAYQLSEPVKLTPKEQLKLIVEIVKLKNVSLEMQKGSMDRAENKIAGWPQLAMTVFAGGSLATFSLLLLASKHRTYARQKKFSFNSLLKPGHHSPKANEARRSHLQKFRKYLSSIK